MSDDSTEQTQERPTKLRVRLVPLDPADSLGLREKAWRYEFGRCGQDFTAEVRSKAGKLSVFREIKEGYGRPGWNMPIDRKGLPPRKSDWAWRVHPDDVHLLESIGR